LVLSKLAGEAAREASEELAAVWLPQGSENAPGELRNESNTVIVDPLAVLTTALDRVVRANAAALLGRQEVQLLLDNLKHTHPAAVKGVVPETASLGLVQRVLQHLVREKVSVRDMAAIVETIADEAENTRDASLVGEAVRRRLAPSICSSLADSANVIRVAALGIGLESQLAAATVMGDRGPILGLEPSTAARVAEQLSSYEECCARRGVIVCSQALRLPLARFVEAFEGQLAILGLGEVVPGYTINVVETIDVAFESLDDDNKDNERRSHANQRNSTAQRAV
jgi:flagellar biosynthesis protein FlhA